MENMDHTPSGEALMAQARGGERSDGEEENELDPDEFENYGKFEWLSDYQDRVQHTSLRERYNSYPRVTVTVGMCIGLVGFLWMVEQIDDEPDGHPPGSTNGTQKSTHCYVNKKCNYHEDPAETFILGHNNNQVLSNLAYIVMGLLTSFYACAVKERDKKFGYHLHDRGRGRGLYTDKYHGMYINASLALIVEGCLSSLYHICPTKWNNEFDYVGITMLCVSLFLMLWSKRHPLIISVGAWAFFFSSVLFMCTLAALAARVQHTDTQQYMRLSFASWVTCFLFYIFLLPRLFMMLHHGLPFIYPDGWERRAGLRAVWDALVHWSGKNSGPDSRVGSTLYFFLFIWVAGVAWFLRCFQMEEMLTAAIMKYSCFFVGAYMLFYLVMEFRDDQLRQAGRYASDGRGPESDTGNTCRRRAAVVVMAVLSFLFMLLGGYFFTNDVYNTKLSKKDSEAKYNKPCYVLGFDNHDLWHVFSGIALGGVIIVSMLLDGLHRGVKHTELAVF